MGKIDFRDPNTQVAGMIILISLVGAYVFFVTGMLPFGYRARAEAITNLEADYETLSADLMKAKQTARSDFRRGRSRRLTRTRIVSASRWALWRGRGTSI